MKLKRIFSGLLVSLIAIVSVLLCVKVSSAEAGDVFAKVNDVSDLAVGDAIAIVNEKSNVAMSSQKGSYRNYTSITISESSFVATSAVEVVTLEEGSKIDTFALKVSDGYLYDDDSGNNILTSSSKLTNGTGDWNVSVIDGVCKVNVNTNRELQYNASSPRFSCYKGTQQAVQIYKKQTYSSNYSVLFNANGFSFVEGKGETITTAIGTDTNVTLPTINDIDYDIKNAYPLIGWNDGTNTYNPGQQVTVSSNKCFDAVFEEDNSKTLSVKEAIALYDFYGKQTTNKYKVIGDVKSISGKNIFITDEDDSTIEFELYSTSTATTGLNVGDKIIGTGNITKYKGTYELNSGCTYEKVQPTAEELFQAVETKTSLSFDWATTDGETYTVSNVSLRFGNLFTSTAYKADAQYGVFVIKSSVLGTSTVEQYLAGKSLEQINADANVCNAVATPAKVNASGVADEDGNYYQFAAVLTEMDELVTEEFTAVMYMIVDGTIYYSVERSASVKSAANAYLSKELELTTDEIEALKLLKQ